MTTFSIAAPTGFKQTESGLIPDDWGACELNDACDRISVGLATSVTKHYRRAGVPIIRNLNIKEGYFDGRDMLFISHEFAKANATKAARAFDVLTVHTGANLGDTCVLPDSFDGCQTFTTLITTPKPKLLTSNFLCLHMSSAIGKAEMNRLQVGGGKGNLNTNDLKQYRVCLPPIAEQEAIAAALGDADAWIESLEQLIAKKRHLKQAAMQQLLTGKTRLPGFEGEWDTLRLGDVITRCSSGATPYRGRPDFYHGRVKWITSGELNYNTIYDTIEHISKEAVAKTNLAIHPAGTFLMAITGLEAAGTRGACGIVGAPATTNQSCMAVYPNARLLTSFLFHYYVFRGDQLALEYCQGTKQQSYTAKLVKRLPIDLPPTTDEQNAIATVLTNMDTEIAAVETKLTKARQIKQGMMQELLTGRTRLI